MPHSDDRARNPLADRRFNYARAAASEGEWREAADILAQVLELAPYWAGAWIALGDALLRCGEIEQAIRVFRRALEQDPGDKHGASLKLAALDAAAPPEAAPTTYVSTLFDNYASRFDSHLTQALSYRGPPILVEAMAEAGRHSFGRAIDLGCGTGLGGVALRPLTTILTGVDLSPGMIAMARGKNLYDHLAVEDVVVHLAAEQAGSADLVFAADVLVYLGDLAPLFAQAARVLRPTGTLAFTVQQGARGYQVGADLRFAHAIPYIEAVLDASGFQRTSLRERAVRHENGHQVAGLVAVASRR